MSKSFTVPTLFQVEDAYRGAYPVRFQEFTEAGEQAGLAPSSEDTERIALILVDYQHDFVDPTGSLSVPGSQDDVARLLKWFYANASKISTIYTSLDTHLPFQIFFSSWWKNPQTGEHPQPFTQITVEDVEGVEGVEDKKWIPLFEPEWSVQYVQRLGQQAKKDLMIWPYHTMEGTPGNTLVAPISEAIAWHSAARKTQPTYVVKGQTIRTEYYGIFGAEIPDPDDPDSGLNRTLLDAVLTHDKVYIAGEAKSHCVLETERQLLNHAGNMAELISRLHFLRDCTSSVQHPAIDFDALAEAELAGMEKLGVKMVRSSEAIV